MLARIFLLLFLFGATACGGGEVDSANSPPEETASAVTPSGQQLDTATVLEQQISDRDTGMSGIPPAVPSGSSAPSSAGSSSAPSPEPSSSSAPPPAANASESDRILARAERVYGEMRSMEADFVQEVYVPLLDTTQNSRGKLYHRSPNGFAMYFSQPQGDVVLADGRYIWMYYPSTDDRQVLRAALADGGQQIDLHKEFLSDATSRFSAVLNGQESVGGRETSSLTLTPRGPSPYSQVRLWIDNSNSLVRRFEITEENGTIRRLVLSSIRTNPTLSDDLFRFTPPAGVEVHDF